MLGGVAVDGQDLPASSADPEHVTVEHAVELRGERRHETGVVVAAAPEALDGGLAEPVPAVVREAALELRPVDRPQHELGAEPFALRAPELHAPALGQPARVADVVGMEVRDDHARQGAPLELRREHALPGLAHVGETDPRVHGRPALAVLHEPEVDVIEREGQGHPQPLDAGGDDGGAAWGGRLRPGMDEVGHWPIVDRPGRPWAP